MKKNAKRIKEKQIAKKKGQIAKQIKTVLFVFTTRPTPFFGGHGCPKAKRHSVGTCFILYER
ncbi:MAG: hypothetical protein IKH88_14650 [Prevotella sp.]|nr:hypothetical protein [Prevotella sp.]